MNLTDEDIAVLDEPLDDEYKAYTTYDQVIKDFGEVRPFSNIREAEGRHIGALLTVYRDYDLPIPENTWRGAVPRYRNLQEACKAGVRVLTDGQTGAEKSTRMLTVAMQQSLCSVSGRGQGISF